MIKMFDKQMTEGKISNAIRQITDENKGGILSLKDTVTKDGKTKTVLDILQEKHPKKQPTGARYVQKTVRQH